MKIGCKGKLLNCICKDFFEEFERMIKILLKLKVKTRFCYQSRPVEYKVEKRKILTKIVFAQGS